MKKIICCLIIMLVLSFAVSVSAQDYTFSITIPAELAIRVRDDLCIYYNYDQNCLKDPNTGLCSESKKEFIEHMKRREIKEQIRSVEVPNATRTTENAKNAEIDALAIE